MLATRIATALVALPPAIAGIFLLPNAAVVAIFALLMVLGAWEWAGLLPLAGIARAGFVAIAAAVMAIAAAPRASALTAFGANLIIAAACLWWLCAIFWVARFPAGWAAVMGRSVCGGLAGVIALAAPVAAVAYLHAAHDGPLRLLALLLIVWAADTGAYFAGRALGRHSLAPNVSPGKTREGAVGGLLAAMLAAAIAAWALGYAGSRTLAFIVLGGWVALVSIVGDLTLSMFKRHAGRKDSGALFPGHGGVLDRLDSAIAAAPWFVAGLHWLPAHS